MEMKSGKSEKEEVIGEGIKVSRKWKNWYQNDVDEEIRDLKYQRQGEKRSDQLFLERMMKVAERE